MDVKIQSTKKNNGFYKKRIVFIRNEFILIHLNLDHALGSAALLAKNYYFLKQIGVMTIARP